MRNYLSNFKRQRVNQFSNFNNRVQSVYNRYQKKNQTKNFVMTEKNQKSSTNVLPMVNHVSSFRNIQKLKIKQVWIPKKVFDALTCSLALKFLWVPKLYLQCFYCRYALQPKIEEGFWTVAVQGT